MNIDEIVAKIKESNQENSNQDFRNVPVYDVLEKHGIVRKENDHYILDIGKITSDERAQLIALCNWRTLSLPLRLKELISAFDKNRTLFNPDGLSLDDMEKLRSQFVLITRKKDFPI
jgi:hypothetical protein